jgi:hypothetical protein
MPHHATTNHLLEAAPVPARSGKWRAESMETDGSPFLLAMREAKIQFAPHRVVGNYAEYRRFAAS